MLRYGTVGRGAPTAQPSGALTSFGGAASWLVPPVRACLSASRCNMIDALLSPALAVDPGGIVVSTLEIEIVEFGSLDFRASTLESGERTFIIPPGPLILVPEPTTGGLLALGLVGLRAARRRD